MDITEQLTHESRIALAAAAEITRLRARLEVRDDGGPDGILCRDESIRMQDAEIARLRAEVDLVIAQREAWRVSALTCQRSSAEFAANADRLRAEVEALKAENARLHTANERMRAALERVRCRDWAPDWVRDIANRALEGGE